MSKLLKTDLSIWVIDDDVDDVFILESFLGKLDSWNIHTEGFESPKLAFDELKVKTPNLIFLDYIMGETTGLEILEQLNKMGCHVPIIMLTGMGDEKIAVSSMKLGASDYIVKGSISVESLERAITNALDKQRLQEKIKTHQQDLIAEERLKVVLQMSGATSHELNQPLAALIMATEMILEEENCPQTIRDWTQIAVDNAHKIRDISSKFGKLQHRSIGLQVDQNTTVAFEQKFDILLIEDEIEYKKLIVSLLKAHEDQLTIEHASSIAQARDYIKNKRYDVVLADYWLKDGQIPELMLECKGLHSPPFIVISGKGNEDLAMESVYKGAYDYLPKARLNAPVLEKSIWSVLERSRLEKDIERANEKIAQMATMDELTQIHNRRYLSTYLSTTLAQAKRYKKTFSVCMLDVDHFKAINDQFGHDIGDSVLSGIAARILEATRDSDLCARYGGEEFVLVLDNTNITQAKVYAERLRKAISSDSYYSNDRAEFHVTCSIGIADNFNYTESTADILRLADHALYEAKRSGRNMVILNTHRQHTK